MCVDVKELLAIPTWQKRLVFGGGRCFKLFFSNIRKNTNFMEGKFYAIRLNLLHCS
jgi:hypothetical protein